MHRLDTHRSLIAAVVVLAAAVSTASHLQGQVIRHFDSAPPGDRIDAGGVLSGPGAPGSPASQFNNTAAAGFGNQDDTYEGKYVIENANLVGELGTSTLAGSPGEGFTLWYVYKPDVPNQDPANTSARQFAFFDESTDGDRSLEISMSGRRQIVSINGVSAGTPAFTPAARLMDGDPNTISDPASGSCCSGETEWVFFAATYQNLTGTLGQLNLYGMSESEASAGLQLIHTANNAFGSTSLDLTGESVLLGNVVFNAASGAPVGRPFDASFDALEINPTVISVDELERKAMLKLGIPEPTSVALLIGAFITMFGSGGRGRRSWQMRRGPLRDASLRRDCR